VFSFTLIYKKRTLQAQTANFLVILGIKEDDPCDWWISLYLYPEQAGENCM